VFSSDVLEEAIDHLQFSDSHVGVEGFSASRSEHCFAPVDDMFRNVGPAMPSGVPVEFESLMSLVPTELPEVMRDLPAVLETPAGRVIAVRDPCLGGGHERAGNARSPGNGRSPGNARSPGCTGSGGSAGSVLSAVSSSSSDQQEKPQGASRLKRTISKPRPGGSETKKKEVKDKAYAPSRFCHLCWRSSSTVRMVICANFRIRRCRKVECEKCFAGKDALVEFAAASSDTSSWSCSHCRGQCPERAQCAVYKRTNLRRRQLLKEQHQQRPLSQELRDGSTNIDALPSPNFDKFPIQEPKLPPRQTDLPDFQSRRYYPPLGRSEEIVSHEFFLE